MRTRLFTGIMVFCCSFGWASAETDIPLISLEHLENRLANGGDTTFVVNFWATWCAPCRAEMPYFEELQRRYHDKPLRVLFVSLDTPKKREAVAKFVHSRGLKNEVVLLDEKNEQEFIPRIHADWSGAIPATLFVNASEGIRIFKEQEFDYQQLENNYLSIIHQKNEP